MVACRHTSSSVVRASRPRTRRTLLGTAPTSRVPSLYIEVPVSGTAGLMCMLAARFEAAAAAAATAAKECDGRLEKSTRNRLPPTHMKGKLASTKRFAASKEVNLAKAKPRDSPEQVEKVTLAVVVGQEIKSQPTRIPIPHDVHVFQLARFIFFHDFSNLVICIVRGQALDNDKR